MYENKPFEFCSHPNLTLTLINTQAYFLAGCGMFLIIDSKRYEAILTGNDERTWFHMGVSCKGLVSTNWLIM